MGILWVVGVFFRELTKEKTRTPGCINHSHMVALWTLTVSKVGRRFVFQYVVVGHRSLGALHRGEQTSLTSREHRFVYHSETFPVVTNARGTYEITEQVQKIVRQSQIVKGLCNVFVHHTSASLIICENADPEVRRDLERYFSRLIPDGNPLFRHVDEGPDDMPAHVRSILTQASISFPVVAGRCDLGTWQGIFLWEHRTSRHQRRLTVSILG